MNQAFFHRLYISDDDTLRTDLAEPFAVLLGDHRTAEAETALAPEAQNPPHQAGRRVLAAPQILTLRMSRV